MSLSKKQLKLQKQMLNPFTFGLFKIFKVPMAYLAGIRLRELNENQTTTTVRYKYLNKNPFNSMYFAVLAMTAELSTGALALFSIAKHKESIAVIVVGSKAKFIKKAVGKITFKCKNGLDFSEQIQNCINTKESVTVKAESIGYNENNEIVCEYEFEWSFKVRSKS